MKKLLLSSVLACAVSFGFSQEDMTIKMSVKVEGLPEEYAGMAENDIVTYTKGEKSLTEVTSMMGSQIFYVDKEGSTVLMDQMGNKIGYTMTKAEMDEEEKKDKDEDAPKIEYVNEKKTIAGYECSKAIVTSTSKKSKEEMKSTIWYTDKIKMPENAKNKSKRGGMMGGPNLKDLKGFPMQTEMSMNQGGMEMKVISTVTEVSMGKVDDGLLKVSTDGYKMMSYKEMKEKMKNQQE
ncbi:MAG: hypothetical protein AB7O73_02075 [Bacteroidia bacterium]